MIPIVSFNSREMQQGALHWVLRASDLNIALFFSLYYEANRERCLRSPLCVLRPPQHVSLSLSLSNSDSILCLLKAQKIYFFALMPIWEGIQEEEVRTNPENQGEKFAKSVF